MFLPDWIVVGLAFGTGGAIVLALLLWSSRTQRPTRVRAGSLGSFGEIFPAIQGLTEGWTVGGNSIELMEDGDGFFPELLREIAAAESSVHLQVYAWWEGEICRRVADALARKAAEGVEVRLMVDALGSWHMDSDLRRQIVAAGGRVVRFHGIRLRNVGRINKRDHRKLAIFDGRRAFVFGHGIAAQWEGSGDEPGSWRDLAGRIEGPIVWRLQAVFAQHWMEETADVLADPRYFPDLDCAGEVEMHVVASSPRGGVSDSSILYRLMIATARDDLVIANPYFSPALDVVELLEASAERGVRVRILIPGKVTDSKIVQYAGHLHLERLLEAGIEVHRFQPTLNHQKLMIVDRRWSYLGSANFDERSFDINAEVGVGIVDEGVAGELLEIFERDLERSSKVELEPWRRRPRHERVLERLAFLFHEQI